MTLNQLNERYGRRWLISPGVGAGWYAIRRGPFSAHMHGLGLSEVRCRGEPSGGPDGRSGDRDAFGRSVSAACSATDGLLTSQTGVAAWDLEGRRRHACQEHPRRLLAHSPAR